MKRLIGALALGLISMADSSSAQCPNFSVIGPPGATLPGDPVLFRVESAPSGVRYKWSVNRGTITEGQGTPTITVATDKTMGNLNVTATVELSGLPPACLTTASEATPISTIIGEPLDEFPFAKMTNDDVRTRLDMFFFELANNPMHKGLVVLRIPPKDKRGARNRHVRLILDHATWRKFDLQRIWFGFGTFFEPRATLWLISPGAEDDLPCDKCTIVKGIDLERRPR